MMPVGPKIEKRSDLALETIEVLDRAADAEFGGSPIIRETKWAVPDWHATYRDENGLLVSFLSLFERDALFDDSPVRLVGIGNFVTIKERRGHGYGKNLMNLVNSFIFEQLKVDGALLLCSEDVVPFYSKLDWVEIASRVMYEQPNGKTAWKKNSMVRMSRPIDGSVDVVDLCGLPW